MKITRITPIMADGGHRIIVFIKVETDQPGLFGWGEATLEGKPRAIVGCIEDMAPIQPQRCGTSITHGQLPFQGGDGRNQSMKRSLPNETTH